MAKIYVASSWKNNDQQNLVALLRNHGHQVYDFKKPNDKEKGFSWTEVDKNWKEWNFLQYKKGLVNPYAERGFKRDLNAMQDADICVLLLPCGKSAHTEAGWFKGMGKKVAVLMKQTQEAELMYKLFDRIFDNEDDLVEYINSIDNCRRPKFNAIILSGDINTLIDNGNNTFTKLIRIKPCWIKKLFCLKTQVSDYKQEKDEIQNTTIKFWRENNISIEQLIDKGIIVQKKITHVKFARDFDEPPSFYKLNKISLGYAKSEWNTKINEKIFILTIGKKDDNVMKFL